MTTEGLAGEVLAAEILAACDRALGEIGRRQHMFGWLRAPGAGAGEWLTVDAYYPGNRLVVACAGEHEELLSDLVPAHGLRLLTLDPASTPADPAVLARMIAELPEASPRPRGQLPGRAPDGSRESAVARAFASATAPAQRPRPARQRAPVPPPAHPDAFVAAGLLAGVVLVAVLFAEIYLGLTELALGTGHVLLAFGIALDACARVLGTVGAHRAGSRSWILPCVIGGSPAVAMFALFQQSGPVSTDPAPLAGLLSLAAIAVVGLALLAMLLGI